MAKEFKEYDKKYAHLMRTDFDEVAEYRAMAREIEGWDISVDRWIQADVQHAVYHAADHERWQQFRVSLKGQSTRMKLLRLRDYYMQFGVKSSGMQFKIEKCRVDNYIGALVRGGQLDKNLRVVR